MKVLFRVILAPKERLTPFDLWTETLRVYVEWSTYYHRNIRKKIFRAERLLSDIFSKKIFFEFCGQDGYQTTPFGPPMINFMSKKNFSSLGVTFGHFFQKFFFEFSDQDGCQMVSFWPLMKSIGHSQASYGYCSKFEYMDLTSKYY